VQTRTGIVNSIQLNLSRGRAGPIASKFDPPQSRSVSGLAVRIAFDRLGSWRTSHRGPHSDAGPYETVRQAGQFKLARYLDRQN